MTFISPESTSVTPRSPEMTAEQEARRQQEETNVKVAGATVILALGNIASRVLGLIRETALTFLFGASVSVDAFLVATIVPRTIYDLLIGGHMNGAIVPVLSEIVALKGREELWRVVSILMSLICVMLAVIVLFIEILPRRSCRSQPAAQACKRSGWRRICCESPRPRCCSWGCLLFSAAHCTR
ncbi:hypothetical protein HC776_03645 [bacterium]|nr:hypothetical protein [bacterium]